MAVSPLTAPPGSQQAAETTIAGLADTFQAAIRRVVPPLALGVLVLAGVLAFTAPPRLPVFLASAAPGLAVIWASRSRNGQVLPILPLYAALQALAFSAPLFAATIAADWRVEITPELLTRCSLPLALWLPALWLGWRATPGRMLRQRRAKALSDELQKPGSLPHALLAAAIAIQLLISSPLYWQLLGDQAQGLLTPLRTVASLATVAGAFTGAYAWSLQRLRRPGLWLLLFLVPFYQGLSSLLLSSTQTMVIAALLGLWLGRSRQALVITLAGLLLLAFLNNGKHELRGLYWGTGAPPPSNPVVLLRQWVDASLKPSSASGEASRGNLFTDRFNNLQNLLYVEQQLQRGTPTLEGESITVIPQVLLPRILNPGKVRSQEGQVLLNLHFGRQRDRESTEAAYIAWGFLAEGVGNFGSVVGPLVMGVATGCLIRLSENIGRGQLILSTPGLLSLALMVFWLTSYEMAASTFAAAAFQVIVTVLAVGWWFGR
ncbi:MAG: hypothetical protein VKM34_04295, partial [Cyanobacteriota bacterium]|nr:hypothetical protein [Cyanobacteriota bacterium]